MRPAERPRAPVLSHSAVQVGGSDAAAGQALTGAPPPPALQTFLTPLWELYQRVGAEGMAGPQEAFLAALGPVLAGADGKST